jgi:hypothetical protein
MDEPKVQEPVFQFLTVYEAIMFVVLVKNHKNDGSSFVSY